jgi:hypothetical protein
VLGRQEAVENSWLCVVSNTHVCINGDGPMYVVRGRSIRWWDGACGAVRTVDINDHGIGVRAILKMMIAIASLRQRLARGIAYGVVTEACAASGDRHIRIKAHRVVALMPSRGDVD